jgi:CAAX protease family protein
VLGWAVVFYGALAAAALVWNAWTGQPWFYRDALAAQSGARWGLDAPIGLASAAAVIALSHLLTTRTRWGAALARELAGALGPLSAGGCAALALLSGFAEEVFFRGALQPRLGFVAASLVFGLAHFAPRRTLWPWTGFALIAGFGLGALYEWTGNLAAPIVAHAAVNGVNLWLLCGRAELRAPT